MNTNDLKIFSLFYISEHDNLDKNQKEDLYEFVKKADSFSVMNFLVTGTPTYVPTRHRHTIFESFVATGVGSILTELPAEVHAIPHALDYVGKTLARVPGAFGTAVSHGVHDVGDKIKDIAHSTQRGVEDAVAAMDNEGPVSHAIRHSKNAIVDTVKDAAHAVGHAYEDVVDFGGIAAGLTKDAAVATAKTAGEYAKHAPEELGKLYTGSLETIANKLADTDTFGNHELFGHGQKVRDLTMNLHGGVVALSGTAAASAIAYLGYKVYKNYFSNAARVCKAAPDKHACMARVRVGAIEQTAKVLASQKPLCKKSKEPAKCIAKIDKKLNKMREKAGLLKKHYK